MTSLTQTDAKAMNNFSAIPLLLGYLINYALFGALAVQVYIYHTSYPKDPLPVKLLVHGLFILEILQIIVLAADLFNVFGNHFGDLDSLQRVHLQWLSVPVLSGVTTAIVQLFFAHRISGISGKKWIGVIIATLALAQGSAAVGQGVQAAKIGVLNGLFAAFASTIVWHTGSALCDVLIAIIMTYYLSLTDKTFKASHDRLKQLTRLIIETGTLTAAVAIVDLILFFVIPNSTYHVTPAMTLAKLSSNSLLMIFNSRDRTGRGTFIQPADSSISMSRVGSASMPQFRSAQRIDTSTGISVSTQRWTDADTVSMENVAKDAGLVS